MDKFEQLASDANFAVCILGNLETSDFELVDLDGKSLSEEHRQKLSTRGLYFIGAMGLVQGRARVAYAEPLDDMTAKALAQAFLQRIEDEINSRLPSKGDGVEWLNRLYRIPDRRAN